MNKTFSSDTLQAEAKKGNSKFWKKHILEQDQRVYTQTEYWTQTKEGESIHQFSEPKEIKSKNVGRSNETSPSEQARLEVNAEILKQKDKGYIIPGESAFVTVLPMLAHEYSKHKKKVVFPCAVQPKLDGVRALYSNGVFMSRQGKVFVKECVAHLCFDAKDLMFDGEIMLPPPYTFQQTIGAVKKFDAELSPKLKYYIYDVINSDEYSIRRKFLSDATFISNVELVSTETVNNEKEIFSAHVEYITEGYEGTMIRNLEGKYLIGHRSHDLLKHKDFLDAEFVIQDVIHGEGKMAECAIFVCTTNEGNNFTVCPKGTLEERKVMYANREEYIGQLVTVKFQNWTDEGTPRFPVGIGLRNYE